MSKIVASTITGLNGAPTFTNGVNVTGIITATTFSGNATGLTGTPNITVGVVTATSFVGSGSSLTGITGKAAAMSIVFGG